MFRLIGKKIVAVKGFETDKRKTKYIDPVYVLFNDKETILELENQDGMYHDCSLGAKEIYIYKDKNKWKRIFNNETKSYPDANIEI